MVGTVACIQAKNLLYFINGHNNLVWSPKDCTSLSQAMNAQTSSILRCALVSLPWCLTAVLLFGCKSATVTGERAFATDTVAKPHHVYVSDFDLGAQTIKHEDSALSGRVGPVGRVGDRLSGASKDPSARARELTELMSTSLVKELQRAGFAATRLQPGAPLPDQGWLIRGVFTEVQEGNRVRRAMIGFGEGQTDVQVITAVNDLAQGQPKPLYEIDTDAASGDKPGAAPTLVLGPYGAAARFVMAGKDLDKNVNQTAAEIAARLAKRVQEGQ